MHSVNCCDKVHNIEFQKLYGMGDGLFDKLVKDYPEEYMHQGEYKDLLAYLIRRLLENGANTSFVFNQVVTDPFIEYKQDKQKLPAWNELYPNRKNSKGYDLTDPAMIDYMLDSPTTHRTR